MIIKSIPEWFANKNILITGGTGFMGKVLISKLLLSCPDIGDIFLIIRKKKGYDPHARLQLLLQVSDKLNFTFSIKKVIEMRCYLKTLKEIILLILLKIQVVIIDIYDIFN